MIIKSKSAGYALLLLFVLSGLAGLIYQSIWSHYLGLTLGHAAYAQTLVLAIFMGGMAVGAWYASRKTLAWRHLILAYAIVELVIGVVGIAFHPIFVSYMSVSQQVVLPSLSSAWASHAYQWISASVLIAPQSILMGATFPLLSAGYMRIAPREQGQILGGLYFTNSLGAALGALITTFVLLPAVGMPGSILAAGLINIAVGIGAWSVWKMLPEPESSIAVSSEQATSVREKSIRIAPILFTAAFITGATSFAYEIGWVRMLNQVLGTTVHSFELMLTAFILGLALGGLWIRRKSASIEDAIRYAGYAQIFMGIAALFSLIMFANSFQWVGWLLRTIAHNDDGYRAFLFGSAVISLVVMLPAAFFAGMTLPLFTLALLRNGQGESSIGRVYASNTLGAIVGVFLTVHLLIPLVGVRLTLMLAGVLDVALGLYLLRWISPARLTKGIGAAAMASLIVVAFTLSVRPDPLSLTSGVFRTGSARWPDGMAVPFLRDGKTATVSIVSYQHGRYAMIGTNGKPDAALATKSEYPSTPDEITMIMAAALPLALHPKPDQVAVIGWGSGLTTHTLLGSPLPKKVETIEIEKAMHDGARTFGKRVQRAYSDQRSELKIDDARTYFSAGGGRKFDVIVSEPSNPWVSGVASLFTGEFYEFVNRHLAEGGLLIQWLHTYEIDDPLVATMVAALLANFPEVDVYITNSSDLLFVAGASVPKELNWSRLQQEPLVSELRRVGFVTPADVQSRYIGDGRLLHTFVKMNGANVHSDYFPTVSLFAPKSRFKGAQSVALQSLVMNGMPVLDILMQRKPPSSTSISNASDSMIAAKMIEAASLRQAMLGRIPDRAYKTADPTNAVFLQTLLSLSQGNVRDDQIELWSLAAANVADDTIGILSADEQTGMWVSPVWMPDPSRQPEIVQRIMRAYDAAARRDPKEMRQSALAVLESDRTLVADYTLEQMLVIAQLGAIGEGDLSAARMIDEREKKIVKTSQSLGYIRSFLSAWSAPATNAAKN